MRAVVSIFGAMHGGAGWPTQEPKGKQQKNEGHRVIAGGRRSLFKICLFSVDS